MLNLCLHERIFHSERCWCNPCKLTEVLVEVALFSKAQGARYYLNRTVATRQQTFGFKNYPCVYINFGCHSQIFPQLS